MFWLLVIIALFGLPYRTVVNEMRNAVDSCLVGMVMLFYDEQSSVHTLVVVHLAHMAGLVHHAGVVRWLDVVMSSLNVVYFIAVCVRIVLDTAHAVGREAA